MPYRVRKGTGARPWKIIKTTTGKEVGSSESKEDALAAIAARYANEKKGGRKRK